MRPRCFVANERNPRRSLQGGLAVCATGMVLGKVIQAAGERISVVEGVARSSPTAPQITIPATRMLRHPGELSPVQPRVVSLRAGDWLRAESPGFRPSEGRFVRAGFPGPVGASP